MTKVMEKEILRLYKKDFNANYIAKLYDLNIYEVLDVILIYNRRKEADKIKLSEKEKAEKIMEGKRGTTKEERARINDFYKREREYLINLIADTLNIKPRTVKSYIKIYLWVQLCLLMKNYV